MIDFGYRCIDDNLYIIGGYTKESQYSSGRYCNEIQKINLSNTSQYSSEILDYKLPVPLYDVSSATVNNCIYLTNGIFVFNNVYDQVNKGILKFHFGNYLNKDDYLIQSGNSDTVFKLINTDNVNIDVNVKDLYVGNFFSSPVDISQLAYLYRDGEWKSLKQINSEGNV